MLDQRYRLGRVLGQGGMASVHLAEDTKLGKAVAVKVLNHEYALQPKVVQRFTQEALAISKVRHPNVVDVTDHGVTPDRSVYLVMELLHGEDLSTTLERAGPLAWPRLGPIVLQICAALATVHRAGIVHRDIKPSNCFRVRVGGNPDFIKVLDFGIAKVLDGPAAPGAPQSTTGSLLGTPEYMAPELPRGLRPDARVDIYAVGVLMYKLLTGSAPFTAEVYMAVLAKHMFDPVEPPRVRAPERDIPPEVEAIVMKALAKERDERWPSMMALADAIAATLPGQPSASIWLVGSREAPAVTVADGAVTAREPTPAPGFDQAETSPRPSPDTLAQPARRRRPPLRTLLLVGVTIAVLGLAWGLRGRGRAVAVAPDDLVVETGAKGQIPAAPRDLVVETGAKGQVPAAPRELVVETGAKGQVPAAPRESPRPAADAPVITSPPTDAALAPEDGAPEDPRPRAPAFDDAAVIAGVQGLGKPLRRCAADQAVLGGFAVRVHVDRRGQATTVSDGPGTRQLPDAALLCMQRLVGALSFPASARGGTVEVRFD